MSSIKDWKEMGISYEELFTHKGLPYWIKLPQQSFLASIIHEIAIENGRINSIVEILRRAKQNPKIEIVEEELLADITKSTLRIRQIINLAIEYNKGYQIN